MFSEEDTFLSTVPIQGEALSLHAFDERWIVPTARAVAAIWTANNPRLHLLGLQPDDMLLLALDQCLSAFAAGEGIVAVNSAGQVVALGLSCDAVAIDGNENAVIWIDPASLSPTTRAYKALMDVLYQPFLARFQEFLAEHGYAHAPRVVSYGLKGGVDGRYRGHKLLSLIISVNIALVQLAGFHFSVGISTHPDTVTYQHRLANVGGNRILHQVRLADFVDPASGQRPYVDAGELHFVLGVWDHGTVGRALLDEAGWSRLRHWHSLWHPRQPERAERARSLVAGLVAQLTPPS